MSANIHYYIYQKLLKIWVHCGQPHVFHMKLLMVKFSNYSMVLKVLINTYSNNTYVHTSMCTHTFYTWLLGIYLCPI